jgi:hypothetical protein
MYRMAAKENGGLDLARDLLAALRAAGAKPFETNIYSEALIRAGDPDEPREAYEYINNNSSLSPSSRLRELRRLARRLSE